MWKASTISRSNCRATPPPPTLSSHSLRSSSAWRRRGRSASPESAASARSESAPPSSSAVPCEPASALHPSNTLSRTPSSFESSRNSLVVKAAWSGPRRPVTMTRRIAERSSAASASDAMSVLASSAGRLVRTRATSSATLPWPITMAVSWRERSQPARAQSGWPLYHATNSRAELTPRKPSPGSRSARSPSAPHASTTAS
mmetsp:Transcript_15700/g.48800  ORF Transcript_15700/g.48800 Transcript_15700/m.48800 type:complete len:201 (-) Transcript_15700:374-976(-)